MKSRPGETDASFPAYSPCPELDKIRIFSREGLNFSESLSILKVKGLAKAVLWRTAPKNLPFFLLDRRRFFCYNAFAYRKSLDEIQRNPYSVAFE